MYSGSTLRHNSGNMLGAHQKIDRAAYRHVKDLLPKNVKFPTAREILHFEGMNGPDAIKRKSPAKDEPWHYFDPTDPSDTQLLEMIENHIHNLKTALVENNYVRASFEAAWLAHSIVDGLTPAHHYPFEEKIEELWGHPKEDRITVLKKAFIKGTGRRDTFKRNWEFWGAKGVGTTHFLFELGIATTIMPIIISQGKPDGNLLVRVRDTKYTDIFKEIALHIYQLGMYESFHKRGWSQRLARLTREELAPWIVKAVVLAWYQAAYAAGERKKKA